MDAEKNLPRYVVVQYTVLEHREALLKRLSERRPIPPVGPFGREGELGSWEGIQIACFPGMHTETGLVPILEQDGVEYVFSVGLAGSLSADLGRGDLVAPVASVRGDGLTDYWADPRLPAVADVGTLRALDESARRLGLPLASGIFYTTPTMYREPDFVEQWAALGVVGIQMELAQHYLLAHLHGKKAAGLYVVSDLVLEGEQIWRTGIASDRELLDAYKRSAEVLLGAIELLSNGEASPADAAISGNESTLSPPQ